MVWLVSNNPVRGFHLYITLSMLWLFPAGDRQTEREEKEYLAWVRNKTQKQVQLHKNLPARLQGCLLVTDCSPRRGQGDSRAPTPT